jgi:hypothetical protein
MICLSIPAAIIASFIQKYNVVNSVYKVTICLILLSYVLELIHTRDMACLLLSEMLEIATSEKNCCNKIPVIAVLTDAIIKDVRYPQHKMYLIVRLQ